MNYQYAWLLWSWGLFVIWLIFYVLLKTKESKKEMLIVSLWTAIFGLTEPIFVPEYWNPPSLFNLAQNTGFDLESLLFAFSIGGIVSIIYEAFFNSKHIKMTKYEKRQPRHKLHFIILLSGPIIFILLELTTKLNPIYTASIALMIAGLFTWYCRPDLIEKMVLTAFLFSMLYFIFFLSLLYIFPNYVQLVWNFTSISGILISGIPVEEILFAFSFGFYWSSIYEHIKWYKLK